VAAALQVGYVAIASLAIALNTEFFLTTDNSD
jgi:hypothetical protein